MATKAVIGKLADTVGIPSEVTQIALNPMGAALDAVGAPKWAQTAIGLATNPAGTAVGLAKDYGKDRAMELVNSIRNLPNVPSGEEVGGRGEGSSVDQGFNLRRRGYDQDEGFKRGGKVKAKVSSASKRADGIAQRGKTKGRYL